MMHEELKHDGVLHAGEVKHEPVVHDAKPAEVKADPKLDAHKAAMAKFSVQDLVDELASRKGVRFDNHKRRFEVVADDKKAAAK